MIIHASGRSDWYYWSPGNLKQETGKYSHHLRTIKRIIVWLPDCLIVWLPDCLIVWLSDCLIVWLSDCWLSDCLIVWLSDCLIVWLSDCLIVDCLMSDCLIACLSDCLIACLPVCLIVWLSDVWLLMSDVWLSTLIRKSTSLRIENSSSIAFDSIIAALIYISCKSSICQSRSINLHVRKAPLMQDLRAKAPTLHQWLNLDFLFTLPD